MMHLPDGKLFVGLQQFSFDFASADDDDLAVISLATDQFEKVIKDTHGDGAGPVWLQRDDARGRAGRPPLRYSVVRIRPRAEGWSAAN